MSEIIETTLGEVLEIKYGKDHKKLADGDIPLYGSGGIMRYVEKSLYDKPSIMIPRKGSLDNLFYEENPFWTVDTLFWTKIDENQVDPKYLFYLLSLYNLSKYDEGSAVPSLTTRALNEVPVAFPKDKNTQIEIRTIIDNLDQKITLLREQNQTLEELAQTLFKRWFVEFEFPNENGQPYKSSGGKMVESELGEIPEGWRVGEVKDFISKYNTGADAIQKAPMVEEDTGIRCLRIGDLSNSRDFSQWGFTKITNAHFKQYQLLQHDIVITRTSLLGLAYLVPEDLNAVFNNGSIRIRPKDDFSFYLYACLRSKDFRDHISKITNETSTRPNMKMDYLLIYAVLDIPKDILIGFTEVYKSLTLKQNENLKEIQSLTQLRDTLLPKLMSGELRVNE